MIAGSGALPVAVARAARGPVLICTFAGARPEGLHADIEFRIETLGALLQDLKARGVREVDRKSVV